MLNKKFKVTVDKGLKYVYVDWYMVNRVGDVVSGVTEGVKNDNEEFIKPKSFQCTGPFEFKKSYGRYASSVGYTPRGQEATAFPYMIKIMYIGSNEWVEIPITKDNITTFFPKVKWIEINRWNKAHYDFQFTKTVIKK